MYLNSKNLIRNFFKLKKTMIQYYKLMLRNLKNSKSGSESEIPRKSRRDDTLLTVDFNLRKTSDIHTLRSPAGTTLYTCNMCRPCGTT